MRTRIQWCLRIALPALLLFLTLLPADAQQKSYRLPAVDLKQQVIWGATCDGPDGTGLAFGGQDQKADDGQPHTRIKVDGKWVAIHEELRTNNPLQKFHDRCRELVWQQKEVVVRLRGDYFKGLPNNQMTQPVKTEITPLLVQIGKNIYKLIKELRDDQPNLKEYAKKQAELASITLANVEVINSRVEIILKEYEGVSQNNTDGAQTLLIKVLELIHNARVKLEKAADFIAPEPAPRALSPIVYDEKAQLYVLFGGDHLDYLTNDTWVFDPAKKRWEQRRPKMAPVPRANHTLKIADGKVVLSGGYTYTSATGYVSGQYKDIGDGEWTYDIAADAWTGKDKGVEPNKRVYRTGPFHPDFYFKGDKPDAVAFQKQLKDLPANTWVATKPLQLPQLNRDWGTAILDPDRDLILRFSGGHSAHGGSDVLHYHLASNRWELPFPVEFPLGQLYTNTEYPDGFNFNMRPWVTGHTYQNYGYDPFLKKMLFNGHPGHSYIYDPQVADWTGRIAKPQGMTYGDCFYTLTHTPTPLGLVCWQKDGRIFLFDAKKKEWIEQKLNGAKLPGAVVDNSTLAYDSKRDRLLFVSKPYGDKVKFSGEVHALDLKTWTVTALAPKNGEAAAALPYLCQLRYDSDNDLLLVGGTLPPGEDGLRRTPAYDCANNSWTSLKIGGTDPSGKSGRNVSLGLVYDAKRKLFWAVDTQSNVYVLRLDVKSADVQPLR